MVAKSNNPAGLRGLIAGKTALSTVGNDGSGLTYRGYDVKSLAALCEFEEIAYLLLKGDLPNVSELKEYKEKLRSLRPLPKALKDILEKIPATAHPMDVLRTGVSALGSLETEWDVAEQTKKADRLLASLPAICCYWYRYSHEGVKIETETSADSIGGHLLEMLTGEKAKPLHEQAMHVSLILYAEHEFNASTFTARICASTLSDFHSCITGAIGTLRGALHGGANEAAMDMIASWTSPDAAEKALMLMLSRNEKIMGFGHAVYRTSDPRNAVIKAWSQRLSREVGDTRLYAVSERCEQVMWREKELFCNTDFYHASAYHFMGIPTKLFTPLFVMSRLAGWSAHVFEQRANNRIIRPSAEYVGEGSRTVLPIAQR
ncbi:MAG: 2-methylcitrate synthase [Agarilytica sp.]